MVGYETTIYYSPVIFNTKRHFLLLSNNSVPLAWAVRNKKAVSQVPLLEYVSGDSKTHSSQGQSTKE